MSHFRIKTNLLIVVLLLLASAILTVSQAIAAPAAVTIQVFPGTNAIANALNAANAGDTLNIHKGKYPEAITISKDFLTLKSAGDGTVTINGRCQNRAVIQVRADGVVLDGLRVIGADGGQFPSEIDFSAPVHAQNRGPSSGVVKNSIVHDTCDAEYGINVFNGGSIQILNNTADGFSDAGIYIGGITSIPSGRLLAKGNETFGNNRGIIVEDSAGVKMRITNNNIHNNTSDGIFSHNSDGIRYLGNTISNNTNEGLELDPDSDNNVVKNNTLSGNGTDLANDGGTGNCFSGNTFTTSTGTLDACS